MYELVNQAEHKAYQKTCADVLTKTCKILKEKGISAQFMLVGSGARNLITRNGNGIFDLDYNLLIQKAEDRYWNNLTRMKDTVRCALDEAAGTFQFKQSQDSTSVLTVLLHYPNTPNVQFKFDVAIVSKNRNGNLQRLVHNKNVLSVMNTISPRAVVINADEIRRSAAMNEDYAFRQRTSQNMLRGYDPYLSLADQYTWNEMPNSRDTLAKVKAIKAAGKWTNVRERYVELKNQYLSRQDHDHPSFIVYVEAVNEEYGKLPHDKQKGK